MSNLNFSNKKALKLKKHIVGLLFSSLMVVALPVLAADATGGTAGGLLAPAASQMDCTPQKGVNPNFYSVVCPAINQSSSKDSTRFETPQPKVNTTAIDWSALKAGEIDLTASKAGITGVVDTTPVLGAPPTTNPVPAGGNGGGWTLQQ